MTVISGLPPDKASQFMLNGILRGPASWANPEPRLAARTIQSGIVGAINANRGKIAVFIAPNLPIAATVALALGSEESMWCLDCPQSLEGAVFFPDEGRVWLSMGSYSGRSLL